MDNKNSSPSSVNPLKRPRIESASTQTQTQVQTQVQPHVLSTPKKQLQPQIQRQPLLQTPVKIPRNVVPAVPKSNIKEPLDSQRTVQELEEIYPNYKVVRVLGDGRYGKVYSVHDSVNNKDLVVKCIQLLQNTPPSLSSEDALRFGRSVFFIEVSMQMKFHKLGISPKVLGYKISQTRGFLEMESVDGTLGSLLKSSLVQMSESEMNFIIEQIQELMQNMCSFQVEHGDLHLENIGYKNVIRNGEEVRILQLLDFGNACCPKRTISCEPELQSYQLFRSFCMKYRQTHEAIDTSEVETLNRQFRTLMKKFLNIELANTTVKKLLLQVKDETKVAASVIYFIDDDLFSLMNLMADKISNQSQILLNNYIQNRNSIIGANASNLYSFLAQEGPDI